MLCGSEPADPGRRRPWRPSPLVAASLALHGAVLALLLAAPRRRRAALGLMVADHLVLAAAGLWPRSRLLGPNRLRLAAGAERRGEVGLTFDDGPDPEVTPRVLDLLERHGARASFFCIGDRVERWPDLAAEIALRGHRVENHSYAHLKRFSVLAPGPMGREIDRAQHAIEEATGRAPVLFRPPAGLRNPWLEPLLAARGLELVTWSRRAYDTLPQPPGRMAARLLAGLRPGDILLLHDGRGARDPDGRPLVLEALVRILDRLAAHGLRAVPVSDGSLTAFPVRSRLGTPRRSRHGGEIGSDASWPPHGSPWSPEAREASAPPAPARWPGAGAAWR